MEKNKNRTDLLAAGRKKLQQFRQKKDGKGSKSSGKSGKSDSDGAADAASAATKPVDVKIQVPDGERSVGDSSKGLDDLSAPHSREELEASDVDVVTSDLSSVSALPETGFAEATLATTSELPLDDSAEVGLSSSAGNEHDIDTGMERQSSPETLETLHVGLPVPVDLSTPPDLGNASLGVSNAVKVDFVHGEDQVPDVGAVQEADSSGLKQVDRSSVTELEEDRRPALSTLDESTEALEGAAFGEIGGERTISEAEETSLLGDVSVSSGATNEIKEVRKEDGDSVSSQSLVASDVSSTVSPELMIQREEDLMVGSSSEEKVKMPFVLGDSGGYRAERVQADMSDDSGGYPAERVQADMSDDSGGYPAETVQADMSDKTVHTEGRSLESKTVSVEEISPISLSQLAEMVRGLGEDEFRFLLMARESATGGQLKNTGGFSVQECGFSDDWERLEEQFYLTNLAKDMFHFQLAEELELQAEFDHQRHQLVDEISTVSAALDEFRGKNESLADELARCRSELQAVACGREDLQKQFHFAKAECEELSARADDLQFRLERSQQELSNVSTELADCRGLVAALQVENGNLDESLTSMAEERKKVEQEKENLALEYEKLVMELTKCKASLHLLQVEHVNTSGSLASMMEERIKLEEEKKSYVSNNDKLLTDLADSKDLAKVLQVENDNLNNILTSVTEGRKKLDEEKENFVHGTEKLSAELMGCKGLVETLQLENANLNGNLALVSEERSKLQGEKDYFANENENLLTEVADWRGKMDGLQLKCNKTMDDLKEATLRVEQLSEENAFLLSNLELYKAKVREFDTWQLSSRSVEAVDPVEGSNMPSMDRSPGTKERVNFSSVLDKPLSDGRAESSPLGTHKLDVDDDSFGFVVLKERLGQAEKVMQKLEKAIEEMHSHLASPSRSGGKVGAPGVSKLIQAFELQGHNDDDELEEVPSTESQSSDDPYKLTKEETSNLRAVLKELVLDVENANELFKGEINGKKRADIAFSEIKVQYEALEEQSSTLEEANIELVVLYEIIKQHMHNVEAKKGELLVLYEAFRQEDSILKAEKSELEINLTDCRSRVSELQRQLDVLHQSSDERASILEQERNSTVALILKEVGKLDASIGTVFSTHSTGIHDAIDVGSHVAASIEAATKLIEDLQVKVEAGRRDHESMYSLYNEVNEKCNDLHVKNELATGILHKIYGNLSKLVNGSYGRVEESETDMQDEKLLDPLQFGDYDALMEQLTKHLGVGLELVSVNNKLNTELMDRTKEIEELKKRCLGTDFIMKLVEDVEGVVQHEGTDFNVDEPASCVESLMYFLLKKYKEADEQVRLSRVELGLKETNLNELQGQKDQSSFSIIQHENEILILKESLKRAMEDLAAVRSDMQEKVTELEQSEQRVSSLREKLSIAVTKGKGLIVQRDSLKQSLAQTSSELERCLQELQSKDAMLHEVETKLKSYSEAGERVEALESELSYIRNSATALRESFLLKDSALQRIEEILEDLELPEHFLARDIIEKVEWLAKSVTGNLPRTDWDQEGSVGGGSYSDSGFVVMDAWKEDVQPTSYSGDDLRRKYEELQSKFYGLAEQNEMLEQSLKERNILVQRWEQVLDKINMPSQLRSMEPEDRIEWLGGAFSEAVHHCNSLEQKVDKSEGFCESLTADLEESQRRISDLEAAFQSVTSEKEHLSRSLDILSSDYDKVLEKAQLFDVENDKLQNEVNALQENLEESQRRISDLEAAFQSVASEKEHLSGSLEILTRDYDRVSEKAASFEVDNDKLQNELTALQQNMDEKLGTDERIHHVEGEIRRLQSLVSDALQDSSTEDLVFGTSTTEGLELLLRKLIEKSTNLSSGTFIPRDAVDEHIIEKANAVHDENRIGDSGDDVEQDVAVLKKELEEALGDLMCLKEEKDKYMEENQSLVREVEGLDTKRHELQELLNQEEQKSASVREKLNLAVRKGKSLVQQRDSMRQTIDEVTSEVERLKSDIKLRETALSECEQKIKDLSMYQKSMEVVESERLFFRNRLAETESDLQEKEHTLSMILRALDEIDVGSEFSVSDPVEKLLQIGRQCHDLQAAVASSEHDARKSKRAAELLLAELNEVQERNDGLQEELASAASELSELRKQMYSVEADKHEALSRLEKLSAVSSEERENQFSEFMALKSGVDQLKKGFFDMKTLLGDVLSKDLEFLQSLEAGMMSSLKSSDAPNLVSLSLGGTVSPSSVNKENFPSTKSFSDSKMQGQSKYNIVSEICSFVEQNLQDFMKEIGASKEKLHEHSLSVHGEANVLSEIVGSFHQEMASQKLSYESMKGDIIRLESIAKGRDMENVVMRRSVSLLYDACKSSVLEMGNLKAQLVGNGLLAGGPMFNLGSITSVDGDNLFSAQTLSSSEECVRTMADSLLSAVNDFVSLQPEILEVSQREMKSTISNLQKELQEKDIQKDRICVELVSQIKAAEATATSYLQELQPAKARIHDLETRVDVIEEERSMLQKRVNELQDHEATLKDLQERERSLTDVLAAKEQEIEALMQALDEEEAQMEDMTNKIEELEGVVRQKNIDLENAEASRGKAMKKLSITVNKFDELHSLSASLLSEVEKLQSQLQDRDAEISFLRQEVTRCTNDALVASQMNSKRDSDEIHDLVTWLASMVSQLPVPDVHFDAEKSNLVHEYKEVLQKKIASIISELEDLRAVAQSRDSLLQVERSRRESLENSLREKESQLNMLQGVGDTGQRTSMTSEIMEVEPLMQINKWAAPGPSIAPQVRSLRKANNDQVAIAVDMDPGSDSRLEDEDDDKAHGFKSLTTSKIVPRFTRPVSNVIDGLWVSCDRALMRQPALRLGVVIYWVVMHALLAAFVV